MDKQQLDEFVKYYRNIVGCSKSPLYIIDHIYEQFGREFIFSLPVRVTSKPPMQISRIDHDDGYPIWHSTTGPASQSHNFYWILDYHITLDEWLPRSALSPEEQTIYKLKHG